MSALTQAGLEQLVPLHAKVAAGNKKTQSVFDGDGLLLNVGPDGRAEWILRVIKHEHCFDLPLSDWPNCDLKRARQWAQRTRDMVQAGRDLNDLRARPQTETKGAFLVVERLQPLVDIAVEAIGAPTNFEQIAQEHRRVLATVLREVAGMLDANSDTAIAFMDVIEVAALLRCDPQTVELNTREGRLPGLKFGRSWVYPRAQLLQVIGKLALANTKEPPPRTERIPTPPPMVNGVPMSRSRGRPRRDPPVLPPVPDTSSS